jgi:DNA-binding protein HU-beta
MTKADLVARIAQGADLTKRQSKKVLQALIGNVQDALKNGDHVTLVGFGTFAATPHRARYGRNPRTGQTLFIGARKTPTFRAGKRLRAMVK